MFCDVFSFKPDVYVGTLNLIASIPYLLLKGIVGHINLTLLGLKWQKS